MFKKTINFSINNQASKDIKQTLKEVYNSLEEKGYNPINQMVGYIFSQDPTYITTHNNARKAMSTLDRDDLLRELIVSYLKI